MNEFFDFSQNQKGAKWAVYIVHNGGSFKLAEFKTRKACNLYMQSIYWRVADRFNIFWEDFCEYCDIHNKNNIEYYYNGSNGELRMEVEKLILR